MSLTHLLTILRVRWLSAGLVFALVMAAVLAKTFTEPPRYTATASVLVDVRRPDPVAGVALQGLDSPSYMLTQVDIIRSLRVARMVVKSLGLQDNAELQARWREAAPAGQPMDEWLAERLQKSLDARPSRGSNVINVSYEATEPAFGAAVANAFVQSYIDATLELRIEPAQVYNRQFEVYAKQLRATLEAAKARLSAYEQSQGIVETDEKFDIESARLAELSSQVLVAQNAALESGGRQGATGRNAAEAPEVMSNGVIAALKGDLTRQEARFDELNARYGEEHPQLQEAKANIAKLRARIDVEVRRVSGSVGIANTVNQGRLASLRVLLEQQRTKVLEMKSRRNGAAVLRQDVESAQRAYDAALTRVSQTGLEGKTAQANVSLLEPATTPTLPSSPKLRVNLVLGGLLSAVLALGMALWREMRDRRLRLRDEVPVLSGQPLIAVVPSFRRGPRAVVSGKRLAIAHLGARVKQPA